MDYRKIKENFIKIYDRYSGDKTEIDYFLCYYLNVNLFEVKNYEYSSRDYKILKKLIIKHLKTKMPIQKLLNRAYFYSREFYVDNNVLTPRFDSEILIERALKEDFQSVLDLCSGSGALGITLKKEREDISVDFADISSKALKVTKKNCKRYDINAKYIKTDMFKNIKEKYNLIICNPPYIETETINNLSDEVKYFDPVLALDGGIDGLKFYNIIFDNIDSYLNDNGKCILEIGYNQGHLADLFKEKFKNVELIKDYNNLDRAIYFEKE